MQLFESINFSGGILYGGSLRCQNYSEFQPLKVTSISSCSCRNYNKSNKVNCHQCCQRRQCLRRNSWCRKYYITQSRNNTFLSQKGCRRHWIIFNLENTTLRLTLKMELFIRKRVFGRVMVYQEKELITTFKSVQLRKSGESLTYLMVITTYSKKKEDL